MRATFSSSPAEAPGTSLYWPRKTELRGLGLAPPSVCVDISASLFDAELSVERWVTREQSFLNIFLVWTTHRDTWTAVQDRVVASVLATVPKARLRVVSNTLPRDFLTDFKLRGYDAAVMRFDMNLLLAGLPGKRWLADAMSQEAAHTDTHLADFLRLALLYKYGGLYLDTDALWLRDLADLPVNFIGKVDYLKLADACDFCVDKRWYLANGILSFAAQHPFLYLLLQRIDGQQYDASKRTAIGPEFLTRLYLASGEEVRGDVLLLEEDDLYPIPGPEVPHHFTRRDNSWDIARSVLQRSHSVHVFAYTYNRAYIQPNSTYSLFLDAFWPEDYKPVCQCIVTPATAPLCVPRSVVIQHKPFPHAWHWPSARICIKIDERDARLSRAAQVTVSALHGSVRTWALPAGHEVSMPLRAPHYAGDDLATLEYRHLGGHCNDVLTVTLQLSHSVSVTAKVPVSAPCIDGATLLAVPAPLKPELAAPWSALVGPEVASVTPEQLSNDAGLREQFTRCLRYGSLRQLGSHDRCSTKVGLIVSATGTYVSWLEELIASAEQYFLHGFQVHYFVLSDQPSLAMEPRGRIHVLHQPQLGWPYDSMFRHQLYLKHRHLFKDMKYLMVLDADAVFVQHVGEEILGHTMGALQSFFFGQPSERAPFETVAESSSFVPPGTGKCYYAGGLFGGSYAGFVSLLQRTTWLMEWDLAVVGKPAPHDDESYLNKAFLLAPPEVSLGGNYIFPEPPADRAWGLRDNNWKDAYPPRIYNLGARKWLGRTAATDRQYNDVAQPMEVLTGRKDRAAAAAAGAADDAGGAGSSTATSGSSSGSSAQHSSSEAEAEPELEAEAEAEAEALVTVAVCAPLSGSIEQRIAWMAALHGGLTRWYSDAAAVVVVDTEPLHADDKISSKLLPAGVQYAAAPAAGSGSSGSSGLRGEQEAAGACGAAALRTVASHIKTPYLLLVDTPVLLTWQAQLPFLQQLVSGARDKALQDKLSASHPAGLPMSQSDTLIALCPRRGDEEPQPAAGKCGPVTGTGGALPFPFPSFGCGLCATDSGYLAREVTEEPAVRVNTDMRSLTCWEVDTVADYHAVVLSSVALSQAVRALASDSQMPRVPGASGESSGGASGGVCGMSCSIGTALQRLGHKSEDVFQVLPRVLSCLPDMQPMVRYDITT